MELHNRAEMQQGALRAVIARYAARHHGMTETDREMIESAFWAGVEVMADIGQCAIGAVSLDLQRTRADLESVRSQLRDSRKTLMEEYEEARL